jgi:hypothetical protein
MNVLLTLHNHLSHALQTDPLHQLALLTTTLDPLWQIDDEEFDSREGGVDLGLWIARRVFPDVYVEAVLRRNAGASEAELERLLCAGFTQQGIPLDDIAFLGYGIPLTACGLTLEDPDTFTHHPDLLPVLDLFGICPEPDAYSSDIPQISYKAAYILADSLVQQTDAHWQQVGWLLAWLFGCSGNSLIDLHDERLCEIQPLSWDTDDVAFAIEMITEAHRVLDDAEQAQIWLNAHPAATEQLRRNIHQTYRAIARQKDERAEIKVRLMWPAMA